MGLGSGVPTPGGYLWQQWQPIAVHHVIQVCAMDLSSSGCGTQPAHCHDHWGTMIAIPRGEERDAIPLKMV